MCLLLIAYRQHPHFPLLLLANRDEFFRRPSAPAHRWRDREIIAGRDLEAGGTWLGTAPHGRVAAVTNMREPGAAEPPGVRSRGEIPLDFLSGGLSPAGFADVLAGPRYRGFNAVLYDHRQQPQLMCAGNRHTPFAIAPGYHGISNGAPDAPWPKVERGRSALAQLVAELLQAPDRPLGEENFVQPALALLADERRAPDADLPDTGIGLPLERALSSIFVRIEADDLDAADGSPAPLDSGYGTRASTLLAVDAAGGTQLWEQAYQHGQPVGETLHFNTVA